MGESSVDRCTDVWYPPSCASLQDHRKNKRFQRIQPADRRVMRVIPITTVSVDRGGEHRKSPNRVVYSESCSCIYVHISAVLMRLRSDSSLTHLKEQKVAPAISLEDIAGSPTEAQHASNNRIKWEICTFISLVLQLFSSRTGHTFAAITRTQISIEQKKKSFSLSDLPFCCGVGLPLAQHRQGTAPRHHFLFDLPCYQVAGFHSQEVDARLEPHPAETDEKEGGRDAEGEVNLEFRRASEKQEARSQIVTVGVRGDFAWNGIRRAENFPALIFWLIFFNPW